MQFPTEVFHTTKDNKNVKVNVLASFSRWCAERRINARTTHEWIAYEWYAYEKKNYEACLDYDNRSNWFKSAKFRGKNHSLSPKELR